MGVCNNCGNQISDGQLTCPVCGAYTGAGAQANNQAPQQNMYNQQGMYNQAPQQNMYNQQDMYNQTSQQPQKELGMKWFHFVIYFQLFVSALVGLWNGFQLLTGRIYGENTDRVYSYFSGLKGVDTIIGICYIAIAIFALVTRFMLADFKEVRSCNVYWHAGSRFDYINRIYCECYKHRGWSYRVYRKLHLWNNGCFYRDADL
ncbi:MAG: zinc-ribbon domain-containing protein [Coprococcus sp.]